MARILKWDVPVDDQEHEIGAGPVVHVACQRDATSMQVWTIESDPPTVDSGVPLTTPRVVLVVGTGQPFHGWYWEHAGSVETGPFVWHLLVRKGHRR
jgi:hypothetical protein